jgi:hypothetical protein
MGMIGANKTTTIWTTKRDWGTTTNRRVFWGVSGGH